MRTAFALSLVLTALLAAHPAAALIAHHPFAIGANEGAVGRQGGLGAWLLAQESRFYLGLTGAVRAARTTGGAALLIGLSFAYGIFHAAGPGHGKAVITSYMVSNEVALRRGLAISFAAAILQGLVATALVAIAAFVFDATAPRMTAAAQAIELASYLGIVGLGLALVWRKGRALVALPRPASVGPASIEPASIEPTWMLSAAAPASPAFATLSLRTAAAMSSGRFFADDGSRRRHGADCDCGGAHMPDPALLEGRAFDWKAAAIAIATAGARPCSGAILVLVFSLSQGLFAAGVAATFAMALGTAITTGALAIVAVFAKGLAMRLAGARGRAPFVGRLVEFAAAAVVLAFGIALLSAALSGAFTAG